MRVVGTTWSVDLAPHGSSVSAARRFVTDTLAEHGLEDLVDDAVLAASELVTNAILHARTPIRLDLTLRGGEVRVTVHDEDETLPVLRSYGSFATTGRGLSLVAALASGVGADPTATGKAVWFTLPFVPTQPTSPEHRPVDHGTHLPTEAIPADHGVTTAVLVDLPVMLWRAARRHEEAALRELMLYHGDRLPESMDAWMWFAAAMSAHTDLDAPVEQAVAAVPGPGAPEVITVEVPVTEGLPARLLRLLDVLDEAELRACSGELLVPSGLHEAIALREWRCTQVIEQASGGPATSWAPDGGDLRRPASSPLPAWDPAPVRDSQDTVVAADDHNRILAVSRGAAARLRWQPEDLVGRRFVALIPPRYRQADPDGVTRHVGFEPADDGTMRLPVLLGDGVEETVRLSVRSEEVGDRAVHVATILPD